MKAALLSLVGLLCVYPALLLQANYPAAAAKATPASFGTLAQFDFNGANPWPDAGAWSTKNLSATVAQKLVGTIDTANTAEPSGGLLLTVSGVPASGAWGAALKSGLLPVNTMETNLGKLTLSFSLSASTAEPITVRVESFDAQKRRTGSLTGTISPAAPDFYQRYALDLSTLKADGKDKFQPTAPLVQFTFERGEAANRAGLPAPTEYQLRVDNVNYARPAYYVRPNGSDKSDGHTEKTAFATPQKALDVAGPGDIIVLMDGIYHKELAPVASFVRPGTPAAWIVLKNYPNQHPLLTSNGWNMVSIVQGANGKISDLPALAYLEVRGLHLRGEGDVAKKKYPDAMNKADSRTNTNGIATDGRYTKEIFHHVRIADNLVEYCPSGGISTNETDWVQIENNVTRYNSWTTIYGTSGISTLGASNFDKTDNVYKILVRNNVSYGNATYEICLHDKRLTDGNGIIIDVNQHTGPHPESAYIGRTLVQNNVCFDNGGSGIHTVRANRVDIINNTAYLNSAHPDLQYSEIFTYGSDDVRIMNNILVAPVANIAAGERPEPVNRIAGRNTNVVFSHNLYFGGNIAPTLGDGDAIGDPQFARPSRDGKTADFHLRPNSPAMGKGAMMPFAPFLDREGRPRLTPPTIGAYEK